MFKFIKKYAETIDNIEIYPIISLIIFFLFFIVMTTYVVRLKKKEIDPIKQLPLDQ